MMEITADILREEIKGLKAQHANALAVAQQALGAISLAESLLARVSDGMTLEELREGLGAQSAEIEPS